MSPPASRCGSAGSRDAGCALRRPPVIRSVKLDKPVEAAIIGGESLIGRELRELLEERYPLVNIRAISGDAGSAHLVRNEEGEAMVLNPLDAGSLREAHVAFLTGSTQSSHKALEIAGEDGPVLIDLTGALEDQPRARLRAPQL